MAKSIDECYRDGEAAYDDAVVVPRAMPPSGEYTVALDAVVDTVITNREGAEGVLVRGVGKVLDGDMAGRRFVIFRGTNLDGSIAGLKAAAELIGGEVAGFKASVDALKAALGTVLQVDVTRSMARDGSGREFTNTSLLGLVEAVDSVEEV